MKLRTNMRHIGPFGDVPLCCAAGRCGETAKQGDENNQGDKNTAVSKESTESKFRLKPGAQQKVCLTCHAEFEDKLKKPFGPHAL